ncbi:hypothetical protein [Delftia acidovorans]|uniref:hypothetical protein n=1 Tax=Delftia acidovorans TaxID=80866 RepID=UPI0022AB578E|nr:hypothetical protein [Delftia acidovorans]WAT87623.1 hypothetical protein O1V13_10385 [Delftia acidovorans]
MHGNLTKTYAVLMTVLAMLLSTFGAHATDISGVKLGMSVAEAKAAFAKPPAMKVIPVHTNKVESGLAGWQGERLYDNSWSGPLDEFLAFKGNAESIWFIQKNNRLPKAERYARQTLLDAVRKKYGKESFVKGELTEKHATMVVGWEFDQDGKQYFGPYSEGGTTITGTPIPTPPCRLFDVIRIGGNASGGDNFLPQPMSIILPTEFKRSCGRAYYVEWTHDADGLVEAVAIRAIDSAAILKAIDGQSSRVEAERRQRTQQQLNKGLKPSL